MNYLPWIAGGAALGLAARGRRASNQHEWYGGSWKRPYRRGNLEKSWPARYEQMDDYGWDPDSLDADHLVWHITDRASAKNILKGGFRPQPNPKGRPPGVSVSVLPASADGLLRSAQRMNSFRSLDQVEAWFLDRGVSRQDIARKRAEFERQSRRRGPAHFYLSSMEFHPAVGGSADIPWNEFLWADIGSNLANKGDIVAVEALYDDLPSVPPFYSRAIEAEEYVVEGQLGGFLTPESVRWYKDRWGDHPRRGPIPPSLHPRRIVERIGA